MAPRSADIHRTLQRILGVLIALGVGLLLVACNDRREREAGPATIWGRCPFPTPNVIPKSWQAISNTGPLINIDGDANLECVAVYRYNVTGENQGPLGGVILNAQVATEHQSDLAVYRLLPWINRPYVVTETMRGNEPGYLGIIGESGYNVRLYDTDLDGDADELAMLGTDAAGRLAYVSLYRWAGFSEGYRLLGAFHGSLRVELSDPVSNTQTLVYSGTVPSVLVLDSLYDRSGLALVRQYNRQDNGDYKYWSNWFDYAYGQPPSTCYYPEGATLNYFRGLNRLVFELKVWYEHDLSRQATVCAGTWELSENEWRRRWSLVQLENVESDDPEQCDVWTVRKELIEPGRITCNP